MGDSPGVQQARSASDSAWGRLGRAPQALLLAAAGLLVAGPCLPLFGGAAVYGDVTARNVVGTAVGVAGVLAFGWAMKIAFAGRRWFWKLLAVPIALVTLQFYAMPMVVGGLAVNAPQRDVPSAATLEVRGARDVAFRSADGVRLAGWYVPGRSRAAVILAHGSHDTRMSTVPHLRLLSELGYGVLAYDARGHGESGGTPNALGWRGVLDLAGAVRFLRTQPHVDGRRIGVLGLSMGAEEGLRAAADGVPLAAVIADGAGASTTADAEAEGHHGLELLVERLGFRAASALSSTPEPPALVSRVDRIRRPVLLIASGREGEIEINRALAERLGDGSRLWTVPDAAHTHALERRPAGYRSLIRTYLGRSLR